MDKIITWVKPTRKPNPAFDSGINYDEIWEFYPEFFDKCSKTLTSGSDSAKKWIENLLEFLQDWDSLTWNQFASVFKPWGKNWSEIGETDIIVFTGEYIMVFDKKIVQRSNQKTKKPHFFIPKTDRELDELYKKVYKIEPRFWQIEQKGYLMRYNRDGNREFYPNC